MTGGSEDFTADLAALKRRCSRSYQVLASSLDRPVSTIHGWVTGKHIPYARDNDDFEHLLRLLGVEETAGWMARLSRLRISSDEGDFVNPYKGLESFTELESNLFHGRRRITRQLEERVAAALTGESPWPCMVIGASGSGKTSVLRAGLTAQLAENSDNAVHYFTPGNDPMGALVNAIRPSDARVVSPSHHVVIIDQFEELFHESNMAVVDEFAGLLEEIHDRPRTALVIGLRADFFHRVAAMPFLLRALQRNQVIVGPMTTEEVTDCIVLPADWSGLTVAPDLLAELLAEFAQQFQTEGSSEALPLLSHVLYLLADSSDGRELALGRYREIGGLADALQISADAALASLGDDGIATARFLFTRLVELGVDSLPTRRSVELDMLGESTAELDLSAAIDRFAENRLLTISESAVTISHEALLAAWPQLVEWIAEERDALVGVRRLQAAAETWVETDRDPDALLRGSQLKAASELLESPTTSARLTSADREFLSASSAGHDERVVERARVASRGLSAQALALRMIRPSLSAQVALVANQTASTVESRSVLLGMTSPLPGARFLGGPGPTALGVSVNGMCMAFSNSVTGTVTVLELADGMFERTMEIRIADPGNAIHAIALSADGRLLAAGGPGSSITLVNLDNGEITVQVAEPPGSSQGPMRSLLFDPPTERLIAAGTETGIQCWKVDRGPSPHNGGALTFDWVIPVVGIINRLAFHFKAGLLAAANNDGSVTMWNLKDRSSPCWEDAPPHEGPASAVAISPDGNTLVVGYHSGRVRVWTINSESELTEFPLESDPFGSWVNWVAFSPDGTVMSAASSDGNVGVWDASSWEDRQLDLRHPTVVTCVRCVSNRFFVTAAEDGTVRTWEIPDLGSASSDAAIWSLSFDTAGERLASCSRTRAALWSIDNMGEPRIERTIRPPANLGSFSGASCISPDGDLLAVGTRGGVVLVIDTAQADDEPLVLNGLTSLVENLAISNDGSMLCGVDHDGNAQIWTIGGDRVLTLAAGVKVAPPAMCPAFGIDSSVLAVASESGEVSLFDVTRPQDPTRIATVDTGRSFALSVAFHPSVPLMAVANGDRTVSLWLCDNIAEPKMLRRLTGPSGKVMKVAFNPAGDMLAAGVTDGKVWIWDTSVADAPTLYAVVQSRELGVYSLAFSADGKRLLGAGPHQRIFSWILGEKPAAAAICAATGDTLTRDEWSDLIPGLPYRKIC